jgi:tripartite-type tricarboxylate transporter receptor subunit TctC
MLAGVDLVHVPYRGGAPALTDLLGGQVQVIFSPVPESIEHIKAGRLRPLAVTAKVRLDVLPGIPTMSSFLPEYEASGWQGTGAPKNTPAEVIGRLSREINLALVDPQIRARLTELGGTPLEISPAEFGKFIADETEKWGRVIRAANVKVQ